MNIDQPNRNRVPPAKLPALLLVVLPACNTGLNLMDPARLNEFAAWYTAAWCSQNAASVASCFAEAASLTINAGNQSVGRAAITAAAQGFMTALPGMVVKMDRLVVDGGRITYHWTLTGTNTGPGGRATSSASAVTRNGESGPTA
jgi:hypothetical protein